MRRQGVRGRGSCSGRGGAGLPGCRRGFPSGCGVRGAVEPGEGGFDDPAQFSEAGSVLVTAAGDAGCDVAGPQLVPVFVVVIAAAGIHVARRAAGSASDCAYRWAASISGISWVTSLRLLPVSSTRNGVPRARHVSSPACPDQPDSDPLLGYPVLVGSARSPPPRGKGPADRPRAAWPAGSPAAVPTPPACCHSANRRQHVEPEPNPSSYYL